MASTLSNCTLTSNFAEGEGGGGGGGAWGCALNNSILAGNSAGLGKWENMVGEARGGGAGFSTLNNCTVTGNSARGVGGGAWNSSLNNCIVYFNTARADQNYASSALNYCCTKPLPTNGLGNLTADPQLADISHLSNGSPCIGTGSAAYSTGADIDGEAWSSPPSIGCDEFHAGAVAGPCSLESPQITSQSRRVFLLSLQRWSRVGRPAARGTWVRD